MEQAKNPAAIVTGGANGIGKAIALALARQGVDVIIADIDISAAASVARAIKKLGRRSLSLKVDVASSDDARKMVAKSLEKFGGIDILINCAGGPDPENRPFHESDEKDWERIINKNLKSVRNCTRAVINHMMARRSGKIVNISSIAGLLGDPRSVDYSAAKAGVIGFTMALAKEVAGYGINVNCVTPGPVLTERMQNFPDKVKRSAQVTGLGRLGKPEEVAALVVFLTSDEAGFITGQNYPICGLKNIGVS
jgi:NAD(P)-dependent dehydrogenase (short-subunit alcohol dehydrogenase family)